MSSVQSVGPNIQQPMQIQQHAAQPQYYPEILDVKEYPDHYEYTFKDEASTGKKWGVGIGSCFLPGLGQAINGQWGKAVGMFTGTIAIPLAAMRVSKSNNLKAAAALGIANIGLLVWSIVDAVKNASGEFKQIVPKEQALNTQV